MSRRLPLGKTGWVQLATAHRPTAEWRTHRGGEVVVVGLNEIPRVAPVGVRDLPLDDFGDDGRRHALAEAQHPGEGEGGR